MLKRLTLLLWPIFAMAGSNDGTILLMNDSPFILTATIQAADGTFLGQNTVQPGQQITWTSSLNPTQYKHPGAPKVSLTPYTVIWQCSSEEFYSMCPSVAPGSLIRANECQGTRMCKPKKKQEESPPASTLLKKS
ncbi:MAG TPA: hypothetical protein VHL30_00010 [Chlamydiales bacterium]|jgi:hypothetical protein|nr:hypothetical protein [Chlamydiales bacterium]